MEIIDINNDVIEIINLLSKIKSDKERKILMEKMAESKKNLLKEEVKSRRLKSREIIMELAQIDRNIKEFEVVYNNLKEKKDLLNIEAVEQYLDDIKKYRKKLVREKNILSK